MGGKESKQKDEKITKLTKEAELIRAGVDLDDISDETVPMPVWEHEFRREYVSFARESIFEEVTVIAKGFYLYLAKDDARDEGLIKKLNKDFPQDTWWGRYARKAFYEEFNRRREEGAVDERFVDFISHNFPVI